MGQWWWWSAFRSGFRGGVAVQTAVLSLVLVADVVFGGGLWTAPVATLAMMVIAVAYYGLIGVLAGSVAGVWAVGWAMLGRWVVVWWVCVPLGIVASAWISHAALAQSGQDVLQALAQAAAERDLWVAGLGATARAYPAGLIWTLPLMFSDFNLLLVQPHVLAALAWMLALNLAVVGLGMAAAVVVTMPLWLPLHRQGRRTLAPPRKIERPRVITLVEVPPVPIGNADRRSRMELEG